MESKDSGLSEAVLLLIAANRELAQQGQESEQQRQRLETQVAEHARVQRELEENRALRRGVLNSVVDGILTIDQQGRIESINKAGLEIFGYPKEVLIGVNISMLMPSPHREQHDNYIRNYLETGQTHIIGRVRRLTGVRRGGRVFPLELSVTEVQVNGRRLFTGVVRDVTQQERDEAEAQTLSLAVENSPTSVVITDAQNRILYVNPQFVEMTGYRREEVVGRNPRLLKSGEKAPKDYQKMWKTILEGKVWFGEFHNRRKDGSLFWASTAISAIRDGHGHCTHFVAVEEDITERKRTDAALQAALTEVRAHRDTLSQERELIENIIAKMRQSSRFDPQGLRYLMDPVERSNGDLLLAAARPDGVHQVLIGDFTGHGLSAAIGGPIVEDIFYAMTAKGFGMDEILQEINGKLYGKLPTGFYLACCGLALDRACGRLTIWNSGMPDVLIFDEEGALVEMLPSTGLPLGIVGAEMLGLMDTVCEVVSGGCVAAFSDGAVEAADPAGQMFGLERMTELLGRIFNAGAPLELVRERLARHRASREQEDDTTMVVLKL
ncbi:MAG: PAS domain S-box protein [Magnetococcales bacterium]|nr:PAS domain S-box protein [Magnetococcales bacterium]